MFYYLPGCAAFLNYPLASVLAHAVGAEVFNRVVIFREENNKIKPKHVEITKILTCSVMDIKKTEAEFLPVTLTSSGNNPMFVIIFM